MVTSGDIFISLLSTTLDWEKSHVMLFYMSKGSKEMYFYDF